MWRYGSTLPKGPLASPAPQANPATKPTEEKLAVPCAAGNPSHKGDDFYRCGEVMLALRIPVARCTRHPQWNNHTRREENGYTFLVEADLHHSDVCHRQVATCVIACTDTSGLQHISRVEFNQNS